MKKLCQVVRLPSKKLGIEIGDITKPTPEYIKNSKGYIDDILGIAVRAFKINSLYVTYFLYVTSDDVIKDGDYFYYSTNRGGGDGVEKADDADVQQQDHWKYKKVIASTDESLDLPGIPESFLKKYVEENGKIDEILVEFKGYKHLHGPDDYTLIFTPKTREDNTIKIMSSKTYTRGEAIVLVKKAFAEGFGSSSEGHNGECHHEEEELPDEWIEENLK